MRIAIVLANLAARKDSPRRVDGSSPASFRTLAAVTTLFVVAADDMATFGGPGSVQPCTGDGRRVAGLDAVLPEVGLKVCKAFYGAERCPSPDKLWEEAVRIESPYPTPADAIAEILWSVFSIGVTGVAPDAPPGGKIGDVVVKAGARLNSTQSGDGDGGRVMLVGPNVRNEGTICTPGGQTILAAGKVHHYLRGTYYVLDASAALVELKQRYPGLGIGRAPEPVFTLGDGIRADVVVGRLGARLGWLEELRAYKAEGDVYRRPQIEIVLREDGFVERSTLPAGSFALKSVTIGAEVPDSVFALPPTAGLQDLPPRIKAAKEDELEDSYRRWILETSTADATLETLVRIELLRKYEPEKMTEVLSTSLQKSLAAFRALHPDSKPDFLKEKITASATAKPAEQAFLLPSKSPILDNNFFVHREVLAWRYLASACKTEGGSLKCPQDAAEFGTLVPQDRISVPVRMELVGKEKVNIRGSQRDLLHLKLTGDSSEWGLWLDDQDHYKLIRVAIPADDTEVVRD